MKFIHCGNSKKHLNWAKSQIRRALIDGILSLWIQSRIPHVVWDPKKKNFIKQNLSTSKSINLIYLSLLPPDFWRPSRTSSPAMKREASDQKCTEIKLTLLVLEMRSTNIAPLFMLWRSSENCSGKRSWNVHKMCTHISLSIPYIIQIFT